jgi:hypothetical protein
LRSGEVVITPGSQEGRKAWAALRLQLKSRVVRSRLMGLLLEGVMVVFFAYICELFVFDQLF